MRPASSSVIYFLADARADNRPALVTVGHLRRLLPYLPDLGSLALRRKVVEMVPHEGLQRMKAFADTMHRRSVEILREKQRALQRGDEAVMKHGRDIMSILSAYLLPWPSVQYDSVLTLFSESEHGGLCRG